MEMRLVADSTTSLPSGYLFHVAASQKAQGFSVSPLPRKNYEELTLEVKMK